MSCRTIETVEFTCDGHCGMKAMHPPNAGRPSEPPIGWIEVRGKMTGTGSPTSHFCLTCTALVGLVLWNRVAQLAVLKSLDEVSRVEDYGLEDRFEKLQKQERAATGRDTKAPLT